MGGFLDRQAVQPPVREVAEINSLCLELGKRLLLRLGLIAVAFIVAIVIVVASIHHMGTR
ncbi:hypothetical protein HZF05_15865 [Sphingomonas sp. CGMCC 1.13654]|uniref:Uncharacterized protein n=1 Tax=Sphingomonas chungangi TaxID=2683589 RepID=A0A838L7V0_9SPHN|nr:hypothetical protein [Sphingomonas chungangi]